MSLDSVKMQKLRHFAEALALTEASVFGRSLDSAEAAKSRFGETVSTGQGAATSSFAPQASQVVHRRERMYKQDAKHKLREKQKKEGLVDYAENASIHGINYVLERNVVAVSRYLIQIERESLQSGAAYHSQGFEDKNLGSSPCLLGQ